MVEVPDPLHPAVVHFPIVLIFLGTLISILTIFTRRGALPQFAAVILILAAGSAQFAVYTGGEQADDVIQRMPSARPLIHDHAEWGERMRTASVVAAIVAVLALAFYRARGFRRILALMAADHWGRRLLLCHRSRRTWWGDGLPSRSRSSGRAHRGDFRQPRTRRDDAHSFSGAHSRRIAWKRSSEYAFSAGDRGSPFLFRPDMIILSPWNPPELVLSA